MFFNHFHRKHFVPRIKLQMSTGRHTMRTHNFRNLSRALWQHALMVVSRWGFSVGVMADAGMGL